MTSRPETPSPETSSPETSKGPDELPDSGTDRERVAAATDTLMTPARCPNCGAGATFAHPFAAELPWVVRCERCALTWAHPQPADDELAAVYDEHYYEQFGFVEGGMHEALERTKRATYGRMLASLEKHVRVGKIIDVGCGLGYSVKEAKARGWDAIGLDPLAAEDPEKLPGRKVIRGTLEDAELPTPFDAVTLIDVIEHVRDPVETIRRASELLTDAGFLLLATNDISSPAGKLMGPRWTHLHRAHLWFFTPETLRSMTEQAGLEVIEVLPAWRVYSLEYIASILARGENFRLAQKTAQFLLDRVPTPLQEMSWPPLPEGFFLMARRRNTPSGS